MQRAVAGIEGDPELERGLVPADAQRLKRGRPFEGAQSRKELSDLGRSHAGCCAHRIFDAGSVGEELEDLIGAARCYQVQVPVHRLGDGCGQVRGFGHG
ncbi:hypothetical protein A5779_14345 [Mycolicibacterium peregrinum]|uniref:Uncharacterized protein n=1 Tax=Mycolicibacterium peregrinum TaxID=43304 RepID=A0A1A0WGF3_MYCPR|nr:hypothetical protein A5779_14345 [Mycolicibacterium peregrinum]